MPVSYPSILFHKILAIQIPPILIRSAFKAPLLAAAIIGLGLVLASLPLRMAIPLVGAFIFLPLILIKPVLALYLLIPIVPFSSLFAISSAGFKVGLMEIVLVSGIVAWLVKLLANRDLNQPSIIRTGPLLWPFLLFLGGIALSWLNTFSLRASLVETAKWVEMFILYLFIINLLSLRYINWVILVIIITGMAQAVLGLYQFIFKVGPAGFLLFEGRFLRAYGTFAQPNPYGGYLGLLLPLVLSLTLWGFTHTRHSFYFDQLPGQVSYQHLKSRLSSWFLPVTRVILFGFPLSLLLAALFASQSRGAWLGFAAAALVVLAARSRTSAMLVLMAALAAMLIALIGSFEFRLGQTVSENTNGNYQIVIQRLADAIQIINITDVAATDVTDANFATLERLAHWQAAREMWRDNVWLGVGFGNYAVVYPAYAVGRWLDPLGHAHNYLLNIGAETGLIGAIFYLVFWVFIFGLIWVAVQWSDGFYKAVAVGGLGVMVHLHIHNLVDNLYVQGMYLHIAIILGLVSIIFNHYRPTSTPY